MHCTGHKQFIKNFDLRTILLCTFVQCFSVACSARHFLA